MTRVLSVVDSTAPVAAPVAKSAVSSWSHWLGLAAAIGCAIHCAAMPFLVAYLPALGLSFLADEAFDKWMAVGCFAIAVSAFVPGFRRHGRLTPVLTGCLGLGMITTAAFGFVGDCCPPEETNAKPIAGANAAVCVDHCCPPENDTASTVASGDSPQAAASLAAVSPAWLGSAVPWFSPFGACVLVAAHLLNRRYGSECGCCESEGSAAAADQN